MEILDFYSILTLRCEVFAKSFIVYKEIYFKLLRIVFFMHINYGVVLSY